MVSSIPKVGTIRIEQVKERSIDTLTYRELSNIVEGKILLGADKSDIAPKAFFVASNLTHLRERNPRPSTMIIGEYDKDMLAYACEHELPVMLTGGSGIAVSDKLKEIPVDMIIIATPYDIFDSITAINQAIVERVKKRELVTV